MKENKKELSGTGFSCACFAGIIALLLNKSAEKNKNEKGDNNR